MEVNRHFSMFGHEKRCMPYIFHFNHNVVHSVTNISVMLSDEINEIKVI